MAYFEVKKKPPLTFPTLTGSIVTFNSQYAGLPLKSHKIALTATQSGSGTPSPDNIRSINGHSAINVSATGKNLVDFNSYLMTTVSSGLTISKTDDGGIIVQGTPTGTWARITLTIPVFLPVGYSYTFGISEALTHRTYLEVGYDNGTTSTWIIGRSDTSATITPDANVISLRLTFSALNTSQSYDEIIYPMVELGSTATEWKPNNGTYTTIQIGSTVYGGEYDARTGVWIPNKIGVDLGSLTWTYDSQYTRFKSQNNLPYLSQVPALRTIPIMCSCYMEISNGRPLSQVPNYSIYAGGENRAAYVHDNRYTDPNDFKTAVSGQYVVYPILAPYTGDTIQLPPCPIDTLEGVNNIWADTGNTNIRYIKVA